MLAQLGIQKILNNLTEGTVSHRRIIVPIELNNSLGSLARGLERVLYRLNDKKPSSG
jgi:hypothetical protein